MTRDEAIKYLIRPVSTSTVPSKEIEKQFEAYEMAIEALKQEPVVHAHWIEDYGDIVCSNCGARYSDEIVFMSRDKDVCDLPHCPTCTAKMDEVVDVG